ncbi:hypothetical protein [Nocardia nova]|uniref:hypothetical protein n=1 Tax=Nocardia nova TaxID=37330 RepID=UPI0004B24EC8|nr:hypothetical protein [Nocardia nova]
MSEPMPLRHPRPVPLPLTVAVPADSPLRQQWSPVTPEIARAVREWASRDH